MESSVVCTDNSAAEGGKLFREFDRWSGEPASATARAFGGVAVDYSSVVVATALVASNGNPLQN